MTFALEVDHVSRSFGALKVTQDVSFGLPVGGRVALIGPNGAGKTTLVNLISGVLKPSSGRVMLQGRDVTHLSQRSRVEAGLVRTFQVTRLFNDLTVEENVMMAVVQRKRQSLRMLASLQALPDVESETAHALAMLKLGDKATRRVGGLAYGEQRLVEIALALALRPKVLFLDEPAAGVPQGESELVMQALAELPADIAILFIEHDMDLVFRFASRILVLVAGALLLDGSPEVVAADPRVRSLYLGEAAHAL